ncbi:hypothetical protein BGW80DRAFT_1430713 [Lactifluus volemus]|nr:hypothetical protein BGW80DRAFT_1430713 [Lactifluus volemus]
MSVVSKARLPMRIIALPLTSSVRGPRHTGEPSPLVYYHFQMPPKAENKRTGLIDWATGKATSIWARFGKAPESSWKYKVFAYGERLVDRVDFEELALKGVDPSMGPKLSNPRSPTEEQKKTAFGFYMWMLLAPLTAPFMLIPSLLQRGAIVPHSDADLDDIYTSLAPSNALLIQKNKLSEDKKDEEQKVLLGRDAVPQILQLYGLPESAATDIYRAVSQANARLREGILQIVNLGIYVYT